MNVMYAVLDVMYVMYAVPDDTINLDISELRAPKEEGPQKDLFPVLQYCCVALNQGQ